MAETGGADSYSCIVRKLNTGFERRKFIKKDYKIESKAISAKNVGKTR